MLQVGDMVEIVWGLYKGQHAQITVVEGKRNLIVRLVASGWEVNMFTDHVKKHELIQYVARTRTGKTTHIATNKGIGSATIVCGAGMSGTWRHHVKVGDDISRETVTCAKCRAKFGL